MKFSYRRLQEYFAEPLPPPAELAEQIVRHAFEVETIESAGEDYLLEVKILPDRTGDAKTELGLAREIGSILDRPLKDPALTYGKNQAIEFTTEQINNLLGLNLSAEEINRLLNRAYIKNGVPPDHRTDLAAVADLADEVARLYGYDQMPSLVAKTDRSGDDDSNFILTNRARAKLAADGFTEIYGYAFTNRGEVEVEQPLAKDKKFLRTNLTDNLRAKVKFNLQHRLFDTEEVKLFEVGTVFPAADKEEIHVAAARGRHHEEPEVFEQTLEEFARQRHLKIEDGNPDLSEYRAAVKYRPFSVFPRIIRDIALWVPADVTPGQVAKLIKQSAGQLLVEGPVLFDEFKRGDKVSYALRLVFQSDDKTLSDEEVNRLVAEIIPKLEANGWTVRK